MELFSAGLDPLAFWAAVAITLFAGFVKGTIGFAMPLIMISGFASFMPPETALAGLILSVVTTNTHQSFRQGWGAAWVSLIRYRRMIGMILVGILIAAPFVRVIPQGLMLGLLGVPIMAFAGVQLAGRSLAFRLDHRERAEYGLGLIGGLYGGVSGVWGPPVIVYLLSVGSEKAEMIRVLGVSFMLGAFVLLGAHLFSGVLNEQTLPFSAILCLPAAIGMWLGFQLQDRLDAERFRRWTLILLLLTGANLLRRAFLA